jgi:MarR-like DNA-binding transcriptional regulator SgrR of sgrS sRNA
MAENTQTSVEAVLESVLEYEDPVVSAVEIAEIHDCSRRTAHRKLSTLHEEGKLKNKAWGQKTVYWSEERLQ